MVGRTVLIGGCGYIGSRLYQFLKGQDLDVTTVDLEWYGNYVNPANDRRDYACLDEEYFSAFRNVILLAGHSNSRMCSDTLAACKNNVFNFVSLLNSLNPRRHRLLYASSAHVYGHTDGREAGEEEVSYCPRSCYDLTKLEIDCYARLSDSDYYALRFGTVCGFSPNLRTDLILNQMYLRAREQGAIQVVNPAAHRAVLGIEDLCRAVWAILCASSRPGVYNVASFNVSIIEAGQAVSRHTGAEVIVDCGGDNVSLYDVRLDTRKFEDAFDFQFSDTPDSILASLEEPAANRASRIYQPYV
jgi:nucleoside-diphosphate-sugar epimerase